MHHQTGLKSPDGVRPSRAQIEPAALALLSRHSAGLLATARRYSITPQDAEDAYQRGVEILLTKAPTTAEDELLPWLRTVVKHEAYAVRKSAARALPAEGPIEPDGTPAVWTEDHAERYERLRLGAEAMASLKPQEIRCLVLKAEGLSYTEICAATGFSYTKVNRCLTEGRRAFLKRVAHIESGAECDQLAPLISKLADGEATAEEMRTVRPHLKSCLACKAALREYRAAPSRLAGLVPPVVVLAAPAGNPGFVGRLLGSLHERFGGMGEIASAKFAVAGSAVVLAGGGVAGAGAAHHDPPPIPRTAYAAAPAVPAPVPSEQERAEPTPIRAPASGAGPEAAVEAPRPTSTAPDPAPSAPGPDRRAAADPTRPPGPEFFAGAAAEPEGSSARPPAPAPPSGGEGEFGP